MSDGSWEQVLADYKFAQTQNWGEDYVWMEKLVSQLITDRDLSTLYPITSHYVLSAFIGANFYEVYNKPSISIELSHEIRPHIKDKFRFKFSLNTGNKDDELFREYVESVYCSFEKSLEVFDEMFEKLKSATNTSLMVYQKTENEAETKELE